MKDKIGLGLVIAGGFCFILSQIFGFLLFQTFNLFIYNIIFLVLALAFAIAGIIVNHRWKKYLSIVITAATITSSAPWLVVVGFLASPKDHFYEGTPTSFLKSNQSYTNQLIMPGQSDSLPYPIYNTDSQIIEELEKISFTRIDPTYVGDAEESFVYIISNSRDSKAYFNSDGYAYVRVDRKAFQMGDTLDTYYSFPKEDALKLMNKAKELIQIRKEEHEEDKAEVSDSGDVDHFIQEMQEKTFTIEPRNTQSFVFI